MNPYEETIQMLTNIIFNMEPKDRQACEKLAEDTRKRIAEIGDGNGRLVLALLSAEYQDKAWKEAS